jgi:DNA-binding response OmpR family regulator
MTCALIVDDSHTIRSDLRDIFEGIGFEPTLCDSVMSARRALWSRPFDLFVFDLRLDDGDGLTLVSEIRAAPSSARLPVLLISGDNAISERIRCIRAGGNDYIGKPYAPEYVVRRAFELTQARAASSRRSRSGPCRVLIVDDSATYGNALANEIRRDHHDVVLAATGSEAIEYLAIQPVDCAILDVFLPDMSGIDVCRHLRSQFSPTDVPILMLTGRKDSVVRDEAFQAGVDDFVVKSPDLASVRVRLHSLRERLPSSRRFCAAPPSSRAPSRSASAPGALLDRVVAASGLSELLARGSIERACRVAGVDAATMTPDDLKKVLPHIQRTLGLFLKRSEADERVEAIALLTRGDG